MPTNPPAPPPISSLTNYSSNPYLGGEGTRTAGQLGASFPTVRDVSIYEQPPGSMEKTSAPNGIRANGSYSVNGKYIYIDKDQLNTYVLPHEVGHAIWHVLPPDQQNQWTHIHSEHIKSLEQGGFEFDKSRNGNWPQNNYPIGDTIARYAQNPAHSFADTVGAYVSNPDAFEAKYPRIYNYMRSVLGREFKKRDLREAMNPALSVPLPGVPEK